jgi:hypothetical protein
LVTVADPAPVAELLEPPLDIWVTPTCCVVPTAAAILWTDDPHGVHVVTATEVVEMPPPPLVLLVGLVAASEVAVPPASTALPVPSQEYRGGGP